MDIQTALQDLAQQVRAARNRDGLTLQQLSTRCGVAASTIHKIESQQMVPTVSVVLKIARGLGCSPQALVRDRLLDDPAPEAMAAAAPNAAAGSRAAKPGQHEIGAWRLECRPGETLAPPALAPGQRATLLVESGEGELRLAARRARLAQGACSEIEGEALRFVCDRAGPAHILLIVSPAGDLARVFGPPNVAVAAPADAQSSTARPGPAPARG